MCSSMFIDLNVFQVIDVAINKVDIDLFINPIWMVFLLWIWNSFSFIHWSNETVKNCYQTFTVWREILAPVLSAAFSHVSVGEWKNMNFSFCYIWNKTQSRLGKFKIEQNSLHVCKGKKKKRAKIARSKIARAKITLYTVMMSTFICLKIEIDTVM